MFPSSGYFKGITCPYFANGLCERPNCHFRHVKPPPKLEERGVTYQKSHSHVDSSPASGQPVSSDAAKTSPFLFMVGDAIKQVQRGPERTEQKNTNQHTAYNDESTKYTPTGGTPSLATYTPTTKYTVDTNTAKYRLDNDPEKYRRGNPKYTVAGQVSHPAAGDKPWQKPAELSLGKPSYPDLAKKAAVAAQKVSQNKSGVPEYKPTPIRILKLQAAREKQAGKNKYSMNSDHNVSENEYDPSTNYSADYHKVTPSTANTSYEPSMAPIGKTHINSDSLHYEVNNEAVLEDDIGEVEAQFSDDEITEPAVELFESEDDIEAPPIEPHSPDLSIFHQSDIDITQKEPHVNGEQSTVNSQVHNHRAESENSGSKHHQKGDLEKKNETSSKHGSSSHKHDKSSRNGHSSDKHKNGHSSDKYKNSSEKDKHRSSSSHNGSSSKSSSSKSSSSKSRDGKSSSGRDSDAHSLKRDSKSLSGKHSDTHSHKKDSKSSSNRDSDRHSHKSHHSSSHSSSKSSSSKSSSSKASSSKASSSCRSSSSKSTSSSSNSTSKLSSSKSSSSSRSSSSSKSRHQNSSGSSLHKTEVKVKTESSSHKSTSAPSSHTNSGKRIKSDPDTASHSVSVPATNIKIKKEKDKDDVAHKNKPAKRADLFGDDSDDDDLVVTKVKLPGDESPHSLVSISDDDDNEVENGHDALNSDDDDQMCTDDELIRQLESEYTDADPFDECLRIYKEDSQQREGLMKHNTTKEQNDISQRKENTEPHSLGKKRIAHASGSDTTIRRKVISTQPASRPSPSQVMLNRYKEMQRRANEQASMREGVGAKRRLSNQHNPLSSKAPRISHFNRSASTTSQNASSEDSSHTTASMVPKTGSSAGATRKAHVPPKAVLKRPTIPAEAGSKVPSNIRQTYLNKIIDECLKIYPEEEHAFERALEEEKAVYARSSNKSIYLNCTVNAIKKLRTEAGSLSPQKQDSTHHNPKALSHDFVLGGSKAANTGFTIRRSGGPVKEKTSFSSAELYKLMQVYILNESQLKENGFPRPDDEYPGRAVIYREDSRAKSNVANEKICVRCGKRFTVFPNGKYAREEECVYHWGKAWKKKIAGSWETRYNCCQSDLDVKGCQVCKSHVQEDNKRADMSGYVKTLPCSPAIDGDYGIYALDCEMVYTNGGCELARVTVIDTDLKPVVERMVKPGYPVVDYNTRFSGITEKDMVGVTTTLRDVQAVLLSLFSDKTILIGHSLESDLVALKLIHSTVVDTSVVFPHRLGLPYKRALRTLMAEYLQRIIQNDVEGHDSMEDAGSCMELMLWKLKEDVKRLHRRS